MLTRQKTKVMNKTEENFILKVGTAGVLKNLVNSLGPNQPHMINVDPNATYREYWCAVKENDPNAVVLSSDDCQKFMEIEIYKIKRNSQGQDPQYGWRGVRHRDGVRCVDNQGTSSSPAQAPAKENFFVKWWEYFKLVTPNKVRLPTEILKIRLIQESGANCTTTGYKGVGGGDL